MRLTITALQCLCFQSAVVLQLNSNFASALVEDGIQKAGTVAANEFVDPGLAAVDDTRFEPADTLPSLAGLANMDFMAVNNPFGSTGSALGKGQVTIDSRSGVVASLNMAKPILPGTGIGNALLWSVGAMPEADNIHGAPEEHRHWEKLAEEAVQNWMHENESFLGINSHDELFSAGRTRLAVHGNGNMIQLSMERTHLGIPVVGNRASATIKRGNLINIGLEHWGKIPKELDPKPSITVQEAFEALAKHSGETLVSGQESCKPELQILTRAKGTKPPVPSTPASPIQGIFGSRGENRRLKKRKNKKNKGDDDTATYGDGYDYTLVWKVCPMFVGQQQEIMEGYVDAHTAQVYSYVDTVDYFNARGSVYPTSNDGEGEDGKRQQDWPMPFMQVGSEITTTGGNYNNGGEQTASYYGPYVDMRDNCGSDSLKQSGGIDWGDSGGTDCTIGEVDGNDVGGAGNTHSSRTGFYELNKMMEIARSRLPGNTWLQGRLRANMNIKDSCNAYYLRSNGSINFYRSGNECGNTGEIAAIFDHEWGHAMDDNDVKGGIALPSGEGIADLYSALRLGDSCIGRGFFTNKKCSTGGKCLYCTGVRDIDYEKKENKSPFTYKNSKSICDNVHCKGVVYSEAVWDLYKRHLQAAPYNYDDNTALEIVTRLTYIAAGNVGTWYSGSDTEGGCGSSSGYKEYLKADDDDASINNGTPHMQAIFDAFNNHGIACRDVSVTDSGCPNNPDSQPIVSVMSGNMAATLTWDSVPNASKYEVLRTEGVFQCGQGKVLLGEVSSNQARTWTDTGLQNGREYYYIVVPKGNDDSCYGPSSDCKAVVPAESPDFYLSCPSEPVVFDDMFLPSTDARECIVSAYGGWTGTTELTCSGFDGINCDIPASVTIANGENEANVLLTIGAAASASKGEGSISVTAVHESITRTSPIDVKILGGGGPQVAKYANGAPTCPSYGSECDSSTLLNGRASVGPETNAPNTLVGDDCDGSAGTYGSDESLEKIIVKSKDGNTMTEGSEVEVIATVYAWDTGSSDSADFYYASDASDPNWQFIETLVPPGGGQQDLVVSYTLPAGENQAVRVNFRYNGAAGPCSGGNWDDADDLVFRVIEDNVPTGSPIPEPTASPTDSPSSSPSEIPTGSPSFSPSKIPTGSPTNFPSGIPSDSPSASPSDKNPTTSPTPGPSDAPSTSASPTQSPSLVPSSSPSASPSKDPTNSPSVSPSFSPTTSPSQYPTKNPSGMPSFSPSDSPSGLPTSTPSTSHAPSPLPTSTPTQAPTQFPTNKPTKGKNKNTKKRRMAMTRSRASAPL